MNNVEEDTFLTILISKPGFFNAKIGIENGKRLEMT